MSPSELYLRDLWPILLLALVGAWLGGCLLISCMGWLWFARKYRARVRPAGNVHRVPTVRFEFIGWYRNMARVVFAKEGIYFCAPFFIRAFHPPFLLPWESVRRIKKKGGFVPSRRLMVEVEDAEGPMRLWFSKAMEEDFFTYYRPLLTPPPARRAFPPSSPSPAPTQVAAAPMPMPMPMPSVGGSGEDAHSPQFRS